MSSERGNKPQKPMLSLQAVPGEKYQLTESSSVVCCTWITLSWQTQLIWPPQQTKPCSFVPTFRACGERCLTSPFTGCRYPARKDSHRFCRAESNSASGCKIWDCSHMWWMLRSYLWKEWRLGGGNIYTRFSLVQLDLIIFCFAFTTWPFQPTL